MGATSDQIAANLVAMGFDNPSQTALYNKIAQAVGILIDNTIQEFANSENNILNTITTQRYGKSGYYTAAALAFQYGDDLTVDPTTGNPVYATINPLNQIISQAAFEELISGNSSQLFIKVATTDPVSGNLEALSAPQLAAFIDYFVNFEIPGIPISIISLAPNVLNFLGIVTYYATYDQSELETNITAALTAFRQTFAFNGEFFAGDINDYMKQNVPGIRDFYSYDFTIDGTPFAGSQTLSAGYFNYLFDVTALPNLTYTAI
jgi:hypothetical protein